MTVKEAIPKDMDIEVDGLRLHYVDWGNPHAQLMVLLHGLQDCARSWDFFALTMRKAFHVLALDHRGHGDSDWAAPGRYHLSDSVADVAGLLGHLGHQRVVLIGHSAGGRNAFMYAISHPESVEALVVVDIDSDAVNPESRRMFESYASEPDEFESVGAVVERLRVRQPSSTPEMLEHQALHMTRELAGGGRVWKRDRKLLAAYERPDLWAEWTQIKCPTLIVRGRQSNLLTHEVAVRMREAIPRARLAELEGGGHWFYQEFPGAFEATVRWFLQNPPL
jgi:pimeloyl-ACP methyl ester carboxylesterase